MRALLVVSLLMLAPVLASAQVVPQGSSPEAVVKILGAPRARTATREREIWSYPGFQVVFENGRVTSLVSLPADGGSIEWKKRPGETPAVKETSLAAKANIPAPATSTSAHPAPASVKPPSVDPKAKTPAPVLASANAGKVALAAPDRRSPPAKAERGWWSRLWPYLLLTAVIVGGVWWALVKVRAWLLAKFPFLRRATLPKPKSARSEETAPPISRGIDPYEKDATKAPTLADWELTGELMRSLEWKRFELLVQRFFGASGFQTKAVGVGADDGADIYLFRAGSLKPLGYVQCRPWGHRRIDQVQVRVLFGIMAAQQIPEGTLVTTGEFEPEALIFGRQNRLNLLTGDEFLARFNRLPAMVRARILEEVTAGDFSTPSCPRCGDKLAMSVTEADKAPTWACRKFPACRYTMEVMAAGANASR